MSEAGHGVKVARWPLAAVQGCGRQGERQRFKRIGPHSAREAALGAAGLGLRDGLWTCRPASTAADEAEVRDWAVDRQFLEVDAAGLKDSLWSTVRQGLVHHAEDIMVLEARAAVKGMERLACGASGSRTRQLFLLDSMSLVLCLCRGRSRSFSALVQLRRFFSYALARDILPSFRWIPSELNSSDAPSRSVANKGSDLATHLVEPLRFREAGPIPSPLSARDGPEALPAASAQREVAAGGPDASPDAHGAEGAGGGCGRGARPPGPEKPGDVAGRLGVRGSPVGAPREESRRQATHHEDEATSEESTTEGVDAGGWNASAAREQRRSRRRLTRHLAEAAGAAAVGQNFLERRSISAATLAT